MDVSRSVCTEHKMPDTKSDQRRFHMKIMYRLSVLALSAAFLLGACSDSEDTSSTVLQCSDPASDDHLDLDNDGYSPCEGDCDDDDANASPGVPEESETDGYDQDCDNFSPTRE